MKSAEIYLQQAGLKSLGFDPGALDGDEGPKTIAAKTAWQNSLSVPGTFAAQMVKLALVEAEAGIRETSKNQGPGIAKYWTSTSYASGYQNREPYCAAFVCWIIAQARAATGKSTTFVLPTSAVAFEMLEWGEGKANIQILPASAAILPGDILVFTFSHVGFAELAATGSSISTIEANTDPMTTANNEGGGVYRRKRARGLIKGIVRILG